MAELGFTSENVADLIASFGGPLIVTEIDELGGWPPVSAVIAEHSVVGVLIPGQWSMRLLDSNIAGSFTATISAPDGFLPKPGWTIGGMRIERVKSYMNGLAYVGHKLWLSGEPS